MLTHPTDPSGAEMATARIEWPMNDHGAMTVRVEASNEVRRVVEYGSDAVEDTPARPRRARRFPLKMESLGSRGNAWRVTELVGVEHTRRTTAPRRDGAASHLGGDSIRPVSSPDFERSRNRIGIFHRKRGVPPSGEARRVVVSKRTVSGPGGS